MAQTITDGPKRFLSQQPWTASAATTRMGDSAPASSLSPKAPLRSISHGNFSGTGSVGSTTTKRATSVVEEMETKQRENMSRKLKDLQMSSGRGPQPKVEMPTIVDSRSAKNATLTRSALRRDSGVPYQAVTPAALSLKGGPTTATPSFSLSGPELFPLRASQSLTSLNRIYDRGFSVFASDDFDNYSTEKENRTAATGSVLQRPSLSSSVCAESLANTPPLRDIKPAEEKAVEDAIDSIFKHSKATSLTGDTQYAPDKQQSKQNESSRISGISPTAEPPLKPKTYPKPQVPSKSADLKAFPSKEGKDSSDLYKAASSSSVPVATPPPRYNQTTPGDLDHSSRTSVGVVRDQSVTVETPVKTDYVAKNYNDNSDTYRRRQQRARDDDDDTLTSPKLSFQTGLQVDVNRRDVVIPTSTSDSESSDFTARVSTRLGALSGSRVGLQSNVISGFISHQKMDSLLSDCNTVDSGLGRSEAAGSPGSLYQDSADELDSKGSSTGWTATVVDSFTDSRHDHQLQPFKRQTKKAFVSTAAISLSPTVTETPTVNYIGMKPTEKDASVSTRRSYNREASMPASSLPETTTQETFNHFQEKQRLFSVPSSSAHSTTPSQPTSGFIAFDSKVAVEAGTHGPMRVPGKKHHGEEGLSAPKTDVQPNDRILSAEYRKTRTSNYEAELSESPRISGSRYSTRPWETEVTEVKRKAEDQSMRDLRENEKRVRDETQGSRTKSSLFKDTEEGKEIRTDVTPSYALNKRNQEKPSHDSYPKGTRYDAREAHEFTRNDNKFNHDPRRADTRTNQKQTPEVKDELYASRDHQLLTMERPQLRQTHLANSSGYEPMHHQPTGTKKEEQISTGGDDEMIEIEVQLIKGLTGLGFCIEGGIDSPVGDKPITVKRLFKGESAAKGKLEPGDVILAINGKPMSRKSHYQAWNQLKSYPEGPINLFIRRRRPLPAGTLV